MTAALTRLPLIQDMEALYQRLYGTPERMRRTDRFLAKLMLAAATVSLLQQLAQQSACATGAL